MQVCTLHRCLGHQRTYLRHNRCRVCICARVCTVCSFALGDEGRGFLPIFAAHLSLGVGGDFWRNRVVVLCLLYFYAGESVCVCMCVYTHTHTHTAHGVLDVSPGVGTRHLEGLKNLDGLNSAYMYSYMCAKYTRVHIYWEAG